MHDAVACSTNDPVRVAPWLLAALRACPAVVIALGSIRRNCIAVWVHARKRGVRICHCVKLNALLVQWPRRFEPSDVSVQWLTTIHNSHGSVMDVVILVVVILSHNQYNRSQGTDSLFN